MIEVRRLEQEDLPEVREVYGRYLGVEELDDRMKKILDALQQKLEIPVDYLVAVVDGDIAGIIGFKQPADHFIQFTKTNRPLELYSLFVKDKMKGVGKKLVSEMERTAHQAGCSEVVVFSAARWMESWNFYDVMGYERADALDRSAGQAQIFRKELI
jgi:predicted N-acetyltransferase YhbS